MRLSRNEIRVRAASFARNWADAGYDKGETQSFGSRGLIETSWGHSKVDGQGAMVGAWRCDAEARRAGIRLADTELMDEIQEYNEVDCRVMQEILGCLREQY